jgi:hypothetical protein
MRATLEDMALLNEMASKVLDSWSSYCTFYEKYMSDKSLEKL